MGSTSQVRKLTYEDYAEFPEDGLRHEILDGEHYMTPSPRPQHQLASMNLSAALWNYCRHTGAGAVYSAPIDVLLSEHDIVVPDLIFVAAGRVGVVGEVNVQGTPDLVVEILSPSTRKRDEGLKRRRYEALGVAEYWLVDPVKERVRVYRREGGGFGGSKDIGPKDRLESPLLPGFALAVKDIFAAFG